MIRKVFIPEEGYVFVDADYSQIELRVLADCSGDSSADSKHIQEAQDIHRITASQVFHVKPFDEVTDLQRRNAKAVNFGIVYGISSFGLSPGSEYHAQGGARVYSSSTLRPIRGSNDFWIRPWRMRRRRAMSRRCSGRRRPVPELEVLRISCSDHSESAWR